MHMTDCKCENMYQNPNNPNHKPTENLSISITNIYS